MSELRAVLLGRYEHDTPEWDGIRSRDIGGSEIAAVVGLSPWVSRFALYHRKRGTLGKQKDRPAFDWGHRLEPVVCDAWAEKHPEFWPMEAGTYGHRERTWQLANVDRLLYPTEDVGVDTSPLGLLEVKTAHQYDAHEWGKGPEDIPPYYRCQVLWYLDVLGLPVAHLAVLIGGSDYREYEIPYAPDEAEWLREQGEAFWRDVTEGNAPEIDGHDATYTAVRELHPEIEKGVEVELDPDLWAEFTASKTEADAATERHRKAKSRVLDQMGQANFAHVNGVSVLRRQPGRGGSVSLYTIPKPKEGKVA